MMSVTCKRKKILINFISSHVYLEQALGLLLEVKKKKLKFSVCEQRILGKM